MRKPLWLLVLIIVLFVCTHPVSSQSLSGQDRDRGLIMLKAVRDDIRKNYYDPQSSWNRFGRTDQGRRGKNKTGEVER